MTHPIERERLARQANRRRNRISDTDWYRAWAWFWMLVAIALAVGLVAKP